jgi:catechol O-methyltransferase
MNPEFAAVIMSLVDLAGLSDIVKVVVGKSDASIARLYHEGLLNHIDLMFLDHYKPAYATDLKLCEELGLVTPGSVLAADNVIYPGNPPYLEYVRKSVEEKRKSSGETRRPETLPDRTLNQYKERYGEMRFNQSAGNPDLVYESKLVHSFEPTGEPVRPPPSRITMETNLSRMASKSRDVWAKRAKLLLWSSSWSWGHHDVQG